MSRVFVVHEPLNKDAGRTKDLSGARPFGELVYLVSAGKPPNDLSGLLPRMKSLLADYRAEDFILPIGHPVLIGWAAALASHRTNGKIKFLYWVGNGNYDVIAVNLEPGELTCA